MASNRLWLVPGNPERLMQARIADSELVSVESTITSRIGPSGPAISIKPM